MAIKTYAQWLKDTPTAEPTRFENFEESAVPVWNMGRWVELVEVSVAETEPEQYIWNDPADPTLCTHEVPRHTIREEKNRVRVLLDQQYRAVMKQGVEGPQSTGPDSSLGPRVYKTDRDSRAAIATKSQALARPGPFQPPVIHSSAWQHESRRNGAGADEGDQVALNDNPIIDNGDGTWSPSTNNNSWHDLTLAVDQLDADAEIVLKTKGQAIEAVDEAQPYDDAMAELALLEADLANGWPAPPNIVTDPPPS